MVNDSQTSDMTRNANRWYLFKNHSSYIVKIDQFEIDMIIGSISYRGEPPVYSLQYQIWEVSKLTNNKYDNEYKYSYNHYDTCTHYDYMMKTKF